MMVYFFFNSISHNKVIYNIISQKKSVEWKLKTSKQNKLEELLEMFKFKSLTDLMNSVCAIEKKGCNKFYKIENT